MLIEISKTVTATGTPERIYDTDNLTHRVNTMIIQAKPTNTGTVRVRTSTAGPQTALGIQLGIPTAATATPPAFTVSSGDNENRINMYQYFIEVSVNGEGVNILAERM